MKAELGPGAGGGDAPSLEPGAGGGDEAPALEPGRAEEGGR